MMISFAVTRWRPIDTNCVLIMAIESLPTCQCSP